jgi:hypothetical protein
VVSGDLDATFLPDVVETAIKNVFIDGVCYALGFLSVAGKQQLISWYMRLALESGIPEKVNE